MLNRDALVDRLEGVFEEWGLSLDPADSYALANVVLSTVFDEDDYPTEGGSIGYDEEDAVFSEYHWPEMED